MLRIAVKILLVASISLFTGCITLSTDQGIMGQGSATPLELARFFKSRNPKISDQRILYFAKTYVGEAAAEGVDSDVAFVQMCLETNWLRFGGQVSASQNNFCGLGALDGGAKGAFFYDIKTGVRAHIQHLKAYASKDSLRLQRVDPRFGYVKRGSAPTISGLTRKWASDPLYDKKLAELLLQLGNYVD